MLLEVILTAPFRFAAQSSEHPELLFRAVGIHGR